MAKKLKLSSSQWFILLIIIAIIIAIFYYTPSIPAGAFILLLFVFIIAFASGAVTQLKAIRRMTDSPKSTIRGASQGNVELTGYIKPEVNSTYFDVQKSEKKGYWKFSIKKQVQGSKQWSNVASFTSHDKYIALHDQGTICWVDMSFVDYHTKKEKEQFLADRLAQQVKKHAILSLFQDQLADATMISLEEEWLPSDQKVYAIGYFSSSPSSKSPSHLQKDEQVAWLGIARKTEGTPEGEPLKGIAIVNTLTMSRFGVTSTPLILSAYSESRLRRNLWFKFWMIIFSVLVLLSLPALYFLDKMDLL